MNYDNCRCFKNIQDNITINNFYKKLAKKISNE